MPIIRVSSYDDNTNLQEEIMKCPHCKQEVVVIDGKVKKAPVKKPVKKAPAKKAVN
jgi:uncharacterized protein with PIN domain